ncbi:hypothetical protein D3C85_657130 [compost metagenome]
MKICADLSSSFYLPDLQNLREKFLARRLRRLSRFYLELYSMRQKKIISIYNKESSKSQQNQYLPLIFPILFLLKEIDVFRSFPLLIPL